MIIHRARVFFDGMTFERDFWTSERAERFAIYECARLAPAVFEIEQLEHQLVEQASGFSIVRYVTRALPTGLRAGRRFAPTFFAEADRPCRG
jgi:hypothetical protein